MIIGLYGCYCHPFKSWKELAAYEKQKIRIGDKYLNRHSQRIGVVTEINENGFVIIKYSNVPRDHELEHKQNLIKYDTQEIRRTPKRNNSIKSIRAYLLFRRQQRRHSTKTTTGKYGSFQHLDRVLQSPKPIILSKSFINHNSRNKMNFYLTPHQTAALINVRGVNTKKALDQIENYKTRLLLRSAFGWNRGENYNQLDLEYQMYDHLMKHWQPKDTNEVDFISEEIRRTAGIILRDLQKIDRG